MKGNAGTTSEIKTYIQRLKVIQPVLVENDNISVVAYLFKSGAYMYAKNEIGDTTLHLAARHGHLKMAEYLITKGVPVLQLLLNSKNKYGVTPLHLAVKEGHQKIVELFLNEGAQIQGQDKNGLTPLHYACIWQYEGGTNLDIVKYLTLMKYFV